MKRRYEFLAGATLLCSLLLSGLSPPARADGTASGTTINNTATVDYQVGGVDQTQVSSNTATFLVDNKVDLTVTTIDAAIVSVVPGAVNQVLTFTVTNNGNTTQDYSLAATASAIGAFGETESCDADNVRVFVDTNGNSAYDHGTVADAAEYVFVVADIPLTTVDGDVASYDLTATTAQGGGAGSQGADITADDSGVADDPAVVQIVFADGAGTTDAANDGQHSSKDGYQVVTATITATKSSAVDSDPINGGTNPKAIPGATVEYSIDVSNTGSSTASGVTVVDAIPVNTSFVVGSVGTTPASGPTVEYSNDSGSTWTYTPTDGGDGTDPAVTHCRVTFASIANGGSGQVVFQVMVE